MIALAILLFIVAEFYGIGLVMDAMGVLATLVTLILTAVVGIQWTKAEGIVTLTHMAAKLQKNEGAGLELVKGGLVLVAGVLFIFPGFISDFLALVLLLPPGRHVVALLVIHVLVRRQMRQTSYTPAGDVILEGEVCYHQETTTAVDLQLPSPVNEPVTPPPDAPR